MAERVRWRECDAGLFRSTQLDGDVMEYLYGRADYYKKEGKGFKGKSLCSRIVALLFFQESTRTRFSFEAAVLRLGGRVVGFDSPENTRSGSEWKESLSDMACVMGSYADCVVMRHGEWNCLETFGLSSNVPVINAGAGTGGGSEHPTQAVVDLFTIREAFGGLEGINILLVGSMAVRTVSSFLKLMRLYPECEIFLYPSVGGQVPEVDAKEYGALGITYRLVSDLDAAVARADVVYHHGVAEDPVATIDPAIRLDRGRLSCLKDHAVVLHSLPRVGELCPDVDSMAQAWYFRQAANGVPVRMALLDCLLGEE